MCEEPGRSEFSGSESQLRHDDRGASLSTFAAVVMVVLFMLAGLVVDGGAKAAAQREAQGAAAQAARAGIDASSVAVVQGRDPAPEAVRVASASLAAQHLHGTAMMTHGVLVVTVQHQSETTFLSLIGIDHLNADARAAAELRGD